MFKQLLEEKLIKKLKHPGKKVRIVLDTDAYNEVDDQFALAYALLSPEKVTVEAVYAAPFLNHLSIGPEDGMEKSYTEILKILEKMGMKRSVFKGSKMYLTGPETPVESEAARDLVERAMASPDDDPLYVVAIGAPTNVASALLMEPKIIEKIVMVWLGGHAFCMPNTDEFNLSQDIYASQIIFDCGAPLVLMPCRGVASHLITTAYELEHYLLGKNELGTYLTEIVQEVTANNVGFSRVIWDIATIAWLVDPDSVSTNLVHSPVLTEKITYSFDANRHFIRVADYIDRDLVFADVFNKLGK